MVNSPHSYSPPSSIVALYQKVGFGVTIGGGRLMRKVIEQDTLAALVKTGPARKFRVLREGKGWQLDSASV